ncbi:SNF2 family N-terminal domain-containing protein [Gamsiella multidivaricata]|uniref:SNF2 family N-terminal domain-containing protein n=1 Tax=Gamsiella multidivaricata TaxID=101098 RepID=UPI00222021A2|nr:SNF2 family N-terminal domain-containing protein [Gamsiella multidivaricata]KAI7831749.1 SNF2 family N-terminal domain-containing protein [Gamsiella multidivaricata]
MLELQELSGCSKTQATGVIELRPFNNYDHLCVTLRKTKGVGEKIVDSYLTTTDAIRAVDQMLKTVDRVREDLVNILSVWCGDENGKLFQNSTSSNSMKISEERAGKKAMKGFIRKQPVNMAPGFQLKGYQLLGINWLALLWRKGLSGILADEMGLGKTAQVITFLAHLFEEGEEGPFLIIVPSSTLSNWMREFEKFCPSLDVRSYYGTQAEREELRYELEEDRTYNVLVTTYAMATGNNDERKFLSRQGFRGVILDEGHMLKNCASARYKQLMSIKTNFRLLLTGTPLQNNLQELLSLLIFIMPKLFAEHEEVLRTMFKVKVDASSEKSTLLSQERIVRARQMIAPFVLRRKKIHVLNDLPRKVERVIYCDLHPDQRVLYDRIMSSSALQAVLRDSTDDLIDPVELDSMDPKAKAKALAAAKKGASKKMTATAKKTAGEFANILMQLRKASDHPMLFRELYTDDKIKEMAKVITKEVEFCDSNIDYIEEDMSVMTDFELHRLCKQYKSVNRFALPGDQWMHAGKVKELERLLPKLIKKDKSRILIFSQFTMVLDILEAILKTMDIVYLRMDGSTKVEERQPLIDTFNDDSSYKVFLLSTKAGGFGINLTGANVVIMYDLDYNPHNDKQAEDRAHRVGQTREVQVIKLVSKNTIEDQIYQLANLKLKLDQHVSQDDTVNDASTKSESSSSSSTPSAGILSLIKKNWKETHNAYVANQQDQQDSAAVTTSISTSNTTVTSMSVTTTATPAKENMKLAATDGSENKAKAVKRSGISRSPSLSSVSSLSSSNSL